MTPYIETTTDALMKLASQNARLTESNTVMLLTIAELHARCTRQQEQIEALRELVQDVVKAHDKEVHHGYLVSWDDGVQVWNVFNEHDRDRALTKLAAVLATKEQS